VAVTPKLIKGKNGERYLETDSGIWRVHDVVFKNRRWLITPLPSSQATHRMFVNEAGVRRPYLFTRGENRQLSATALDAQLKQAKYLAATKAAGTDYGTIGGPPPGGDR
jgi:hypothetical protein